MIIRNWRDSIPYVGHESKIIWPVLTRAGNENADPPEVACLLGLSNFTRHVVQGRITTGLPRPPRQRTGLLLHQRAR